MLKVIALLRVAQLQKITLLWKVILLWKLCSMLFEVFDAHADVKCVCLSLFELVIELSLWFDFEVSSLLETSILFTCFVISVELFGFLIAMKVYHSD